MNKFTKDMKTSSLSERRNNSSGSPWVMSSLMILLIGGGLIFGTVIVCLQMRSETEKMAVQTAQLEGKISRLHCMLENARNRREELCKWESVKKGIERFQIPLHPRKPNQVAYLKKEKSIDMSGSMVAAQSEPVPAQDMEKYTYHAMR